MIFLADGLALLTMVLTLLPLWRHAAWWVRVWDFPRTQLVALMVLALLLRLAAGVVPDAGELALWVGLLACAGLQLRAILPFTPLWRRQVLRLSVQPGANSLALLAVNVLMSNRRADELLEIIRRFDPDVVLAVETDAWWAQRLRTLADAYPHALEHPLGNTYGMVLRSRLPLVETEVNFLVKPDIPSFRVGLELRSGVVVELLALHPEPPSPTEAATSLPRDAELVLAARGIVSRGKAGTGRPVVVLGDLNDVAWSHTTRLFLRLSGLLDPRIGRGLFNSFHAQLWPLRWPLDHVFHSRDFALRRLHRLPAFGSDHFPIMVELEHVPAVARHQEADAPEPEDQEMADETVAAARSQIALEEAENATASGVVRA